MKFLCFNKSKFLSNIIILGITTSEMLLAHIAFQTVIMIIQCLEVILYIAFIFSPENKGDNYTVIALLILTGFAGTLFGKQSFIFSSYYSLNDFF